MTRRATGFFLTKCLVLLGVAGTQSDNGMALLSGKAYEKTWFHTFTATISTQQTKFVLPLNPLQHLCAAMLQQLGLSATLDPIKLLSQLMG